jgi:hypothetical protein
MPRLLSSYSQNTKADFTFNRPSEKGNRRRETKMRKRSTMSPLHKTNLPNSIHGIFLSGLLIGAIICFPLLVAVAAIEDLWRWIRK